MKSAFRFREGGATGRQNRSIHRGISLSSASCNTLPSVLLSSVTPCADTILGDQQCRFRHDISAVLPGSVTLWRWRKNGCAVGHCIACLRISRKSTRTYRTVFLLNNFLAFSENPTNVIGVTTCSNNTQGEDNASKHLTRICGIIFSKSSGTRTPKNVTQNMTWSDLT
jgi:hypothetical protein